MHAPTRLAVLLAGAALLTGCAAGATETAAPVDTTAAPFHGEQPQPAGSRPTFVLQDTDGEDYDFRAETAGRPTLLYFGYVNCPDECPTAMADMAGALRAVPSDLREQTRVVFVTTDPDRDDGPLIRRFLDQFSTEFVGLRGTQAEVDAAQAAVGARAAAKGEDVPTLPGRPDAHQHAPGTAPHEHFGPLGYGVAHADVIFAFDTDDRLPVLYPGGVRPSDLAADLPLLASGENS